MSCLPVHLGLDGHAESEGDEDVEKVKGDGKTGDALDLVFN